MIYEVNGDLKTTVLTDESVDERLNTIFTVMNSKTFGQREAAEIVGGRGRLFRLIGMEKIRAEKRTKSQNGKWFCNAADVLRHARVNYRKKRRTVNYEKSNLKSISA